MVFQNYALYPHMNVRENMGWTPGTGRGIRFPRGRSLPARGSSPASLRALAASST